MLFLLVVVLFLCKLLSLALNIYSVVLGLGPSYLDKRGECCRNSFGVAAFGPDFWLQT